VPELAEVVAEVVAEVGTLWRFSPAVFGYNKFPPKPGFAHEKTTHPLRI